MAKIEKVVKFELTADERTWLSFANLGLAEIIEQLDIEQMDCVMNSETGEVMCIEDFKKAFSVIDYLLDGHLEIQY